MSTLPVESWEVQGSTTHLAVRRFERPDRVVLVATHLAPAVGQGAVHIALDPYDLDQLIERLIAFRRAPE